MIFFDIINFSEMLKPRHRLLGLDVGKVRIGYAFSDLDKFLATGKDVFNLKKEKISSNIFAKICEDNQIFGIVVGHPLQMDGERGDSCKMVDEFIKKYLIALNQPIYLQDERLSSSAVNRYLKEMSLTRKQQVGLTDKASASYILQMALDKLSL